MYKRQIHDLFNKMGFDPAEAPGVGKTNAWMAQVSKDGVTTAFDYDALEIMNRGSWEAYNQVRLDWLGLMSWGRRITGTGNSDSHAMAIEQADPGGVSCTNLISSLTVRSWSATNPART